MPRKRNNLKNKPIRLSVVLFILGLLLISISLTWNIYQKRVLSFSQPVPLQGSSQKTALPERVIIDKFNINLPIIESQIKNGIWEINPSGASHLDISATPGENGNTVIYGHNKKELFGKIFGIKVGDNIKITTQDGVIHSYTVTEIKTVNPDDTYVLLPTPDETLTIYTCSGVLDLKRFIVTSKPLKI